MVDARFPISKEGYIRLEEELHHLKTVLRPQIIAAIAEARAHGDLSENAEYSAAKEKQSFIEAKIKDLESKISRAHVIDTTGNKVENIQFGVKVKIEDEETGAQFEYKIVSEYEADLSKNHISIASPIAKSLIGKKAGDTAEVSTPKGTRYYAIISVDF